MKRKSSILGIALILAALGSACVEPDNSYLMELNRNGKWVEAERLGERAIAAGVGGGRGTVGGIGPAERAKACETYFHVIYAKTRLGKKVEAASLFGEYDRLRLGGPIDPKLLWLDVETARLKGELGLLSEAQRALVAAMEANAKGAYAEARELCVAALAMGGDAALIATANLVAAGCSIRLKDLPAAEAYFSEYERLRPSLPPGHRALVDEEGIRRGLEALRRGSD